MITCERFEIAETAEGVQLLLKERSKMLAKGAGAGKSDADKKKGKYRIISPKSFTMLIFDVF